MRLLSTFLILNVHLSHIIASPPNPLELSQAQHNLKGFECGDTFFSYSEVKEALGLALNSIDKGYRYPKRYRGQLYRESRFGDYFLYPIQNGPQILPYIERDSLNEPYIFLALTSSVEKKAFFFVVLTRNSNEAIDVIARITARDFTKCIRRGETHVGPPFLAPDIGNGYLCGHEFFTDDIIHRSLTIARTKVDENGKYPSPYTGNLFPEQRGLMMWPIVRRKILNEYEKAQLAPYFLILNNEKNIVDVVVQAYTKNILRCQRSRKLSDTKASSLEGNLFVPHSGSGYLCGKSFFEDEILEKSAVFAQSKARNVNGGKFPLLYSGSPFDEQCLIWPLLQDGSLSMRVLSVAMISSGKYRRCERDRIVAKKNHEPSDYQCNGQTFSNRLLIKTAKEACVKLMNRSLRHTIFPARYEGQDFKIDGPYFTYPVYKHGDRRDLRRGRRKRIEMIGMIKHRVVINERCEFVGALTTVEKVDGNLTLGWLAKCHRLADGPLPPGFFGANAERINEYY